MKLFNDAEKGVKLLLGIE